jgi:hypothetical protein
MNIKVKDVYELVFRHCMTNSFFLASVSFVLSFFQSGELYTKRKYAKERKTERNGVEGKRRRNTPES